jgi:galacturonosyltransferase
LSKFKKIAILSNSSGGLWSFRRELIQALAKQSDVVVSTPDSGMMDELSQLDAKFIETPIDRRGTNPVNDLRLFATYKQLLKTERPDLVITYTIKPNIYGGMAAKSLGIPIAANITGLGTAFESEGLVNKLVVALYKKALAPAKVVFFENGSNRDFLVDKGLVTPEQAYVLPGAGVNLDYFQPELYPTNDNPFRFIFIGRIMKEKGIEELMQATKRLYDEGEDVVLDVLGTLEEDYSVQLEQAQSEGWLEFHGSQDDIRPFVQASHCFTLPSYHEGMANTNLECSAMARPIITSNIPGCKEAAIEDKTGYTCEPKNANSLYAAMKKMLKQTTAQRQTMGQAARTHMEKTFDKRVVVENTIARLNRIA